MTPKINSTTDYDLFQFHGYNREVGKITKIKKSIQKADITAYVPIVVDEDYRIIDGQHRFCACRELGLPVYFVMLPREVNTEEAMILLNSNQKQWRQEEYLHFHAEKQGGCYSELRDFETFHKLGITNSMIIYPDRCIGTNEMKAGKVKFGKNPHADAIADFLKLDDVKSIKYTRMRPFVLALKKAFEIYSNKDLVKIKNRLVTIPQCARFEQYLTAFENIAKRR